MKKSDNLSIDNERYIIKASTMTYKKKVHLHTRSWLTRSLRAAILEAVEEQLADRCL